MAKVWEKGGAKLDPVIESYTVGNDYILDRKLFRYELAASAAHAEMLAKIGILNGAELASLRGEIKKLYKEYGDTIELTVSDEDVHSKLENLLTERIGEAGKKLHTGRSRNDQVLVLVRLYEKDTILKIVLQLTGFLKELAALAEREGATPIPGYTHTRQAMPMTVAMWAEGFIEAGLDNLALLKTLFDIADQNPLGTGSGFGVPIPLDREMTAGLMGFSRVMESPVYAHNSRGKLEALIADGCWAVMHDLSRMSADMILWGMDEIGYITHDAEVTTGSSIMPQKRNPDPLELIRGRASTVMSCSVLIKSLTNGMISGYQRDLQESKEPMMKALEITEGSIAAMSVVLKHTRFDPERIAELMTPGIFATDLAFAKAKDGIPFRDAYKEAAKEIESIEVTDELIAESINNRMSPGSHITIDFSHTRQIIEEAETGWRKIHDEFARKLSNLID
ncbi:MAG: argininosuccinate lyase [Spirochaetes bacterium GWF1_51_8]|nr:MAG: argininosuccinate lyase [Spirochaetes bacterium GWF1_51_8]